MDIARMNGIDLEYEDIGRGHPLLLIPTGPIADSFSPFFSEKRLAERYRLITYHRRGQAGSTHSPAPVTFSDQASDAAALLSHLGISRAHVAGHSTGGIVALELAINHPARVHTLILLEPTLMVVPSAAAFMEQAAPIFAAYASGDREGAMKSFISAICGLDWDECRRVIDKSVPGGVAQAMHDADTFFSIDLPAHNDWSFGPEQAARIAQPILSVLGTNSADVFVEGRSLLHSLLPQVEDCTVQDSGHFLHMQNPGAVTRGVADFLTLHPINES